MEIREAMTRPVVSVKPRDSALHARALLQRHRVNQLPVVVDGRLVGIVTDRDLRDAFAAALPIYGRRRDRALLDVPELVVVEDVMTRNDPPIDLNPPPGASADVTRRW